MHLALDTPSGQAPDDYADGRPEGAISQYVPRQMHLAAPSNDTNQNDQTISFND